MQSEWNILYVYMHKYIKLQAGPVDKVGLTVLSFLDVILIFEGW